MFGTETDYSQNYQCTFILQNAMFVPFLLLYNPVDESGGAANRDSAILLYFGLQDVKLRFVFPHTGFDRNAACQGVTHYLWFPEAAEPDSPCA